MQIRSVEANQIATLAQPKKGRATRHPLEDLTPGLQIRSVEADQIATLARPKKGRATRP